MAAKKKTAKKKVTTNTGATRKKKVARNRATPARKKTLVKASSLKKPARKTPARKTETTRKSHVTKKHVATNKATAKKKVVRDSMDKTAGRAKKIAAVRGTKKITKRTVTTKQVVKKVTIAAGKSTEQATASKKSATTKKSPRKDVTAVRNIVRMSTEANTMMGTPRTKRAPYQKKTGEEYMSPAQVEHFRLLLLDWKCDLLEEVDRTVHHMQDEAANFPDPNDRATQEEEFALELRTRDRERKLIKKINDALTSLDNNDYGYCEQCGVEIGIQRLEARPTATLCIDCKTLDEIKEKQLGQ